MAAGFTKLTDGSSGLNQTSYTSGVIAAINPTAGNLVIATILTSVTGGTPAIPTIAGCGVTWAQHFTGVWGSTNLRRLTVFRGMTQSPINQSPNVDFGTQQQENIIWNFEQWSGVNQSGVNGINALGSAISSTISGTNGLVNLPASPGDAVFAAFAIVLNEAFTPGSGFTAETNIHISNNNMSLLVECKASMDTSVDASWTNSTGNNTAVAFPIIAALAAPTFTSKDISSGSVGAVVTINGTNFVNGGTLVDFNGTQGAVLFVSTSQVKATVPDGASTGTLTLSTSGGSVSCGTFTIISSNLVPSFVKLDSGSSGSDLTEYNTTIDITPAANKWIIVAVANCFAGTPATPTLEGCNISSWTQVDTEMFATTNLRRITVFKGKGSAPTTGKLKAKFGSQIQQNFLYSIIQVTNGDQDDIDVQVQSQISATPGTSLTSIMNWASPFEDSNNRGLLFVDHTANESTAQGTNYTELSDNGVSNSVHALQCQYSSVANANPGSSWTTSTAWAAIAVEIRGVPALIAPTFLDMVPRSGLVGEPVDLYGTGFNATNLAVNLAVGVPATVTPDSDTHCSIAVPSGSVTGPIAITTDGGTVNSPDFIAPEIVSDITITGGVIHIAWSYDPLDEPMIDGFAVKKSAAPPVSNPRTVVATFGSSERVGEFQGDQPGVEVIYEFVAFANAPAYQESPSIKMFPTTITNPPIAAKAWTIFHMRN